MIIPTESKLPVFLLFVQFRNFVFISSQTTVMSENSHSVSYTYPQQQTVHPPFLLPLLRLRCHHHHPQRLRPSQAPRLVIDKVMSKLSPLTYDVFICSVV